MSLCCLWTIIVHWFDLLFSISSAKLLAGKTYSRDIFHATKGFPLQRLRVTYCNGLLYVFPTCNIANFIINFTFLT